jgi:hypothetical protein
MRAAYFDTSALAKWYLNEAKSEEVTRFILDHAPVVTSTLTSVEMRSLLARRRRMGDITPEQEMQIWSAFEEDHRQGFIVSQPITDKIVASASGLIAALFANPLRTLDALQLSAAREGQSSVLATADRVMAAAAKDLGIEVADFG